MRHFVLPSESVAKCLKSLDNKSGGDNRDRTDDLLHAMQARQNNLSNLSSNTSIFQLVESVFTRFTMFTWFHKSSGGNLGETHFALSTIIDQMLTISIAQSRPEIKAISLLNHHIKTTSWGNFGGSYGEAKSRKNDLQNHNSKMGRIQRNTQKRTPVHFAFNGVFE